MRQIEYNPPNTRERIAARRRQRRGGERAGSSVRPGPRRALGAWLASGRLFSLALLLASVGALVYLVESPRFTVREVRVEGNSAVKPERIVELSALRGLPIWFVDSRLAVSRLLESAYIEQASVRVAFPDQAVISVVERRPEVRWQLGSTQFLVDSTGKVLDQAADMPEPGTLVIVDTSSHLLKPNDQVDPDALKLAQTLALRLPVELGISPATVGWDFGLGVYIKTAAGQTIVFGRSDNLDRKLAILDYVLKDSATVFTYLDLRPSNPFYQNNPRS